MNTRAKASTEQYDYSFVGWSSETGATEPTTDVLKNITADKSVYAAFEAVEKTFEVKFYNADVLLYTDEDVEYGGTAAYSGNTPTKAETAQYTYTFAGWNSDSSASTADTDALKNVTADREVYAIFTQVEKTFTVTFYNGDTVVDTVSNIAYNGTATYGGDTPTKASTAQYTYTFSGWTKTQGSTTVDADALTSVTANRSVYAVFTQDERSYTVSYYSQDGQTLIDTESVVYGHNASFSGTTPTKASTAQYNYTFVGWNTSTGQTTETANVLDNITADKSVYAAFSETARTYTVYFYNESTLLQTVTDVPYGGSATYTEATPTKTNYTFTGWNPEPTNISGDTSCYAQFEQIPDYITDSWETISNRGKAGTAQNYYSVGDCKPIELNGTMGTLEFDHETVYVYILGFNHNSEYEPNGITFGGFKTAATDGIDVALCDSHYYTNDTSGLKWFNINHRKGSSDYGHNYGGWKGCDMRYDILGSTDTAPSGYGAQATTSNTGYDASASCATNPVANTLMSCLPSDLRAVMKPMTKYTDNVGNSSNVSGNVTASIDYLPLLAEYEIFGARTNANQYEQNKQAQYAYYAASNTKVKKNHSNTTRSVYWWERSPCYNYSTDFCYVTNNGNATYNVTRYSYGVAPIFLVGTAPTTYTVTYYSQDGQTVLSTETVEEGHDCTYSTSPTKASDTDFDYTFTGWSTSTNQSSPTSGATTNIQQDTNLYAAFSKSFKTDTISDSWEDIITACGNGTYSSKYQVGDLKTIDVGSEGPVQMQIVAMDTDVLADSNNTAPITWISKQLLNTDHRMNPSYSSGTEGTGSLGGWEKTEMRSYLKETVKPLIPETVRNAIKPAKKYTRIYNVSGSAVNDVLTTEDVWVPSYQEIFGNYSSESSGVYYSSAFPDNTSRIKSKAGSSAAWWWLRSAGNTSYFIGVNTDGSRGSSNANYTSGVALGFCT